MKELVKYAWSDDRVKFVVCLETGLLIACYIGNRFYPIPYLNTLTSFIAVNLIGGALAFRDIKKLY